MPRAPRSEIFDPDEIGIYHCINRCVRRGFLMGEDRVTGRSYDHRREWVQSRLEELAAIFAIDHLNFSIMGNHLHVLVRNRPDIRDSWSDEEVVRRWWRLFPKRGKPKRKKAGPTEEELLQALLQDSAWVAERRQRLGDLSWFMRCLAENIANRVNREEQISSRFWQGRFKSQRILDACALLACAMYIDLNPIRARLAETPETSHFTSVFERIQSLKPAQESSPPASTEKPSTAAAGVKRAGWLSPVKLEEQPEESLVPAQRASNRGYLDITFEEYLALLDWTGRQIRADKRGSIPDDLAPIFQRLRINSEVWVQAVTHFGRWFRTAVGRVDNLAREAKRRGRRFLQGSSHCAAVFL